MGYTIGQAKAPRGHQLLIKHLLYAIDDHTDDFEALPEPNVNDGDLKSKVPDVVIFDLIKEKMSFCIEITNELGLNTTINKVQNIVIKEKIIESFVVVYELADFLDYEVIEWYRITANGVEEGESYSEILEADLSDLLNEE